MQNEESQDPLIGTVVHNYVVRKRLAAGGMGAVYLADHQDPRSASKKVIKVLLPEFSRHPVIRERFEREAFAVMRLKHPYIVEIDNLGAFPDGQLYLMMEFLDGETLEDHLARRGRCNLHHTLHVIAQVMSALQSLHEAGLVHRDLKPANIFIVNTEQNPYEVRLIDLGIARDLAEPAMQKKTMAGSAMGTPGYMAVEQYEDAASATPAADVYAAAVIVWRMLFGQPPWGDVYDDRVLYFKQRNEDFQPPPGHDVAPEVIALLRKSLSVEPTERPTVADFVNLLASQTAAFPPFVPSGAMILNDVAKRFIKHASITDETVRNVSHPALGTPLSWPHRGTQVARGSELPPIAPAPPAPTPALPATVNERPVALGPTPTTLGASSGVVAVQSAPSTRSKPRALIGAAACVFAAAVAFVIVQVRSGRGDPTTRDRDIAPASASAPAKDSSTPPPPVSSARAPQASNDRGNAADPSPTASASAVTTPDAGLVVLPTPNAGSAAAPVASTTPPKKQPKTGNKPTSNQGKGSASGSGATPPSAAPFDPNAIVE